MNKKLLVTGVLAISVAADGARANPPNTLPMGLYGSDTMREMTIDLIARDRVHPV